MENKVFLDSTKTSQLDSTKTISGYIGETCRRFKTKIEEHIKKDNKSHIFKHLHSTTTCLDSYNSLSFKIIDKANSKFDLKIKQTSGFELSFQK